MLSVLRSPQVRKNVLVGFTCLSLLTFVLIGVTLAQVKPKPEPKGKEPPKPTTPAWIQMESGTSADLRGIWGTSSSNIYAVGYDHPKTQGVILHFDGTRWSTMEGGGDNLLHAVWGTDENNIYAVGYRPYDVAFLKCDGKAWRRFFPHQAVIFLHGVWGSEKENLYAVGYNQGSGWTIIKWNGTRFEPVKL